MAYSAKQQLLELIDQGFHKPAWHGPNLRAALRGVGAEEAGWRPAKGRHNIWEIAVHAAYWKYAVTKRLTGSTAHDFGEKGSNWFPRGAAQSSRADARKGWARDLGMLRRRHRELRSAVAALNEREVERRCRGSRQTVKSNVAGIAMHDVYHAGQIQVLRRLYGGQGASVYSWRQRAEVSSSRWLIARRSTRRRLKR